MGCFIGARHSKDSLSIVSGAPANILNVLDIVGLYKYTKTTLKRLLKNRSTFQYLFDEFDKGLENFSFIELTKKVQWELKKQERLYSAHCKFKVGNNNAGLAFNDVVLKIEEKKTACKICIASSILRHFNDSEAEERESMFYLKKLNSLPKVGKGILKKDPLFKNTNMLKTLTLY